jgi:hypothetical protein
MLRAMELAEAARSERGRQGGRRARGDGLGYARRTGGKPGSGGDSDERHRPLPREYEDSEVKLDLDPPQASGCWRCGSKDAAGGLKVCKGCSAARYCCRACQVDDWVRHKPVCLQIASGTA